MRATTILATLAGFALAPQALARGGDKSFGSAAVTRTEDVSTSDDDESERVATILNISAAAGVGSGLVVGAKYFSYSEDYGDDTTVEITGYGPMVGFLHQNGFYLNIAYLLWPEKVVDAGTADATYSDGNGFVFDLGKVWDVGSSYGVGVAVSKSDVAYEKVKTSGVEADLDGTWSDASLYPYVVLIGYF